MQKLNDEQLKRLSEFTSNLGLVFFATVITPLFTNIDSMNIITVTLGLGATIVSLITSLWLIRGLEI